MQMTPSCQLHVFTWSHTPTTSAAVDVCESFLLLAEVDVQRLYFQRGGGGGESRVWLLG